MTLVEAAAFGCPSLVNGGGAVGATELLGADGCVQVGPACWKVALVAPQLGTGRPPRTDPPPAAGLLHALTRSAPAAQVSMRGCGAAVDACQGPVAPATQARRCCGARRGVRVLRCAAARAAPADQHRGGHRDRGHRGGGGDALAAALPAPHPRCIAGGLRIRGGRRRLPAHCRADCRRRGVARGTVRGHRRGHRARHQPNPQPLPLAQTPTPTVTPSPSPSL